MSGVDRLIAYRTMRAVEDQVERPRPVTRWQRWQAFLRRLERKIL